MNKTKVEKEFKIDWHRAQIRQLERNGCCAFCYADIERLKDEVLIFDKCSGKDRTVILCRDCADKLFKFWNENKGESYDSCTFKETT